MNSYQVDLNGVLVTIDSTSTRQALYDFCVGEYEVVSLEETSPESLSARVRTQGEELPLSIFQQRLTPVTITAITSNSVLVEDDHELGTDGMTVWVNCIKTQCCLGRFSPRGFRIMEAAINGEQALLYYRPGVPVIDDWAEFRKLVRARHRVEVPQSFLPSWLFNAGWECYLFHREAV